MHERRDGGHEHGRSRHERGCDERHCGHGEGCGCRRGDETCGHDECSPRDHDHGPGCDRPAPHGAGPDTRFLQLEMSQVLYAEAERVTRQAFRELLVEAAKARFRERFGDTITGLAQLAVDELMNDVLSSLEIEASIEQRNQERSRTKERLRDIFTQHRRRSAPEGGPPRREGEGGEGGSQGGAGPAAGNDESQ